MVTSKSGVGTAQATASAKITSDSIKTLCAEEAGKGDPAKADAAIAACTKQLKPQQGKSYTVRADCTVGRLEPLDGKSYVLDGLWDNSDVGAGRTRWKGPDGVVGRDTASGGLALSQQWEVLCPGRVSASVLSKARTLSPPTGGATGERALRLRPRVGLRRRRLVHRGGRLRDVGRRVPHQPPGRVEGADHDPPLPQQAQSPAGARLRPRLGRSDR